jgi:hypothetical protein
MKKKKGRKEGKKEETGTGRSCDGRQERRNWNWKNWRKGGTGG